MDDDAKGLDHHHAVKIATIIAANLYTVRKAHGYTQQEFANAAGVAPTQIANGEKSRFQIPVSRLCRISLHTGIPVLDFFRGIDLRDYEFNGRKLPPWQYDKIFEIIKTISRRHMSKKGYIAPRSSNYIDKIIGENIRSIRTDKGWPQYKLAEELDTSKAQMNHYEKGRVRFPVQKLCKISQILDVPLLTFLEGIDLPDHKIQKLSLEQDKVQQIIDVISEVSGGEDGGLQVVVLNNPAS